jgi:hypothetical protein
MLLAGTVKLIVPMMTGSSGGPAGEALFDGLRATFVFHELAVVEIVGGAGLLLGLAVPLMTLGLTPIVATIVVYNIAYVEPGVESLSAVAVLVGLVILLLIHRDAYRTLFAHGWPWKRGVAR